MEDCFNGKIMELNDVCSSTPCLIQGVAAKLWQILTGKVMIYKWLNHQIWGTPFADKPDIFIGVRGLLFAQGSTGKEDEPEPRVTKTGADSWLISCCD